MDKNLKDQFCKCDWCLREVVSLPTFEADWRRMFEELRKEVLSIFPDAKIRCIHNRFYFDFNENHGYSFLGTYFDDNRTWRIEIFFDENSGSDILGVEGEPLFAVAERCYVEIIEETSRILKALKNDLKSMRREKGKNENV